MFDLTSITADDLLQAFINTRQTDTENRFSAGEIAFYATEARMYTVNELAANGNCSASYVRQMVKTYRAFPSEESRIPYATQSYNHFKLAAYTQDPDYWINKATEHEWSTAELAKAIRGEAVVDELREAQRIEGRVVRCIEAGGPGAIYLHKNLTDFLGGNEPADLHTIIKASQEEEVETATL